MTAGRSDVLVGGGLGGAIATVLTWGMHQFFNVDLPPQVAGAFAVILIAIGGWIADRAKE